MKKFLQNKHTFFLFLFFSSAVKAALSNHTQIENIQVNQNVSSVAQMSLANTSNNPNSSAVNQQSITTSNNKNKSCCDNCIFGSLLCLNYLTCCFCCHPEILTENIVPCIEKCCGCCKPKVNEVE